jgi:uncharacterized protein YdeI (YjbR/CyaY-like superfamily)
MAITLPELLVPDASAWRLWLLEHHADAPGVWLVLHRKGGDVTTLTYVDAVEEALCFGWIDGQGKRRDDASTLQRMTPRRARSPWSALNVKRVARLEQEGRMHEAGRVAVRAAQADGRWERAYEGPANAELPADLAAAIAAVPEAQAMWDALTRSNRYTMIYRTNLVKRPETRARKIAEYVEMLARHEAPTPQKRAPSR